MRRGGNKFRSEIRRREKEENDINSEIRGRNKGKISSIRNYEEGRRGKRSSIRKFGDGGRGEKGFHPEIWGREEGEEMLGFSTISWRYRVGGQEMSQPPCSKVAGCPTRRLTASQCGKRSQRA